MNIVWNIQTVLQASGESNRVNIAPQDRWEGVNLSEPILSSFKGVHTTDITKNNKIFPNVPIDWYMIEN
ncbi:hypothetical protein LCGC14_1383900 [marine sediment metagenome]|uniref:Uncharacterized protein n=1 Tax=marine sediment metagenome TaxID=412755 RepID=A0A0F9MHA0_9ZZZZ